MGAGESRPARGDSAAAEGNQPNSEEQQRQPKVLRIERSQIPEAYKNVGVSSEVIRRVSGGSTSNDSDVSALNAELQKERETNARLRNQMQNLTALQNRFATGQIIPSQTTETLEDVEEKKRVFDETVQRVEKQFFSYQRENACEDNEKELMECLSKNKGKVLNCKSLKVPYDECIVKFRHEVLSSKAS
uniref:MICOS complex subunit MIC19 n=1 Tax=Panagrolaimus sp. PS1159 TaxID=55785 RepID=A0AC35EUU1_9BILA